MGPQPKQTFSHFIPDLNEMRKYWEIMKIMMIRQCIKKRKEQETHRFIIFRWYYHLYR